jgi:hypothetical protein
MRATLATLVLASLSVPAVAAEWTRVTTAADGTSVYIGEVSGSPAKPVVWIKLDYKTKHLTEADRKKRIVAEQLAERGLLACGGISPTCVPGEDEETQALQLWAINCVGRTLSIRSTVIYNATGRVLRSSGDRPTPTALIVPDTIADNVSRAICL